MSYTSADIGTTRVVDDIAGMAGSAGAALGTGTGQHGVAHIMNGSFNPFATLRDWLQAPFTMPLSAVDMFLIVGTVLVSILLWNLILFHIRIAAETL